MSGSALIIIDVQNDFVGPGAPFAIDSEAAASLRAVLVRLIPSFRAQGGHVIWVKSHYALVTKEWKAQVNALNESPAVHMDEALPTPQTEGSNVPEQLSWVIDGTHLGKKPCCQEGTLGAGFTPWIQELMQEQEDSVVIKTYYSAFKHTVLESLLRDKGVTTIYLAGLLSNMCVLATALYAMRMKKEQNLEWEIFTVRDALAWRNAKSHARALETMEVQGIGIIDTQELIQDDTRSIDREKSS